MQDIPRLLSAFAQWGAILILIFPFFKPTQLNKLIGLTGGGLALLLAYHYASDFLPISFWIISVLGGGIVMYFIIYELSTLDRVSAVYYAGLGFLIAEFTQSFEWQFHTFYFSSKMTQYTILSFAIAILAYAGILGSIALYIKRHQFAETRLVFTRSQLWGTILIVVTAFFMSNISFVFTNTPFSGQNPQEIFYIRTLVDFSGLVILFTLRDQYYRAQMSYELKAIQDILYRQYEQYKLSKESMDLINIKYHDLKHQIAVIKAESNQEKQSAYINALEADLKAITPQTHTGNKVLDTLINAKLMTCKEYQINLTVVANGQLLDFIEVMDLCTLFGNALDNAIESVKQIADSQKRLIRIAVYKQNRLLMIKFENYYENEIEYTDGLPNTTKANKRFHGFGLKSIKATAEKYSGTVSIKSQNNWFTLCVLLPLK